MIRMEEGMISQILLAEKKCFIVKRNIPAINKNRGESL
jgi:hypothetical protein